MEWVEVKGRTVEVAVQAALVELGLDSVERAEVEILQEPEKGFLGIGRSDAVVRVKPKPKQRKRKRKRREKGSRGAKNTAPTAESKPAPRNRGRSTGARGGRTAPRNEEQGKRRRSGERTMDQSRPPAEEKEADAVPEASPEEQAQVIREFLEGLLESFGLEGEVNSRGDDGVILADVAGPQTEALIGERGAIMQAIHEVARTVAQRKTHHSIRLRLDVAGYAERRREALRIYARRLSEQLLDEGGEAILEPMNASDRKVIHDTVAEIDGIRSYSEGEEPNRSVVLACVEE